MDSRCKIIIHNEGKSGVAKRRTRTLMNKTYKCMISVSKCVYVDKLADIVNKCSNTYTLLPHLWVDPV